MRSLSAIVGAAVLAWALVGCQSGPSVVGKWNSNIGGLAAQFEFTSDGKMKQTANAMNLEITASGTYVVQGETLKITVQDVTIPNAPKALMDMAKSQAKLGTEQSGTIKFTDNDNFTLTVAGANQTFSRIK